MKKISGALKKGFTLIELLIVIAILAILAAAVVIVINPAEMLAQARDSQRVSDLNTVRDSLVTYIAQVNTIELGACTATGRCTANPGFGFGPFASDCGAAIVGRAVDGTGWIDVNLTTMAGGAPIPALPIDPTNSTTYFYGYACVDTGGTYSFELDTRLESSKYRSKMTADGGDDNTCSTFAEATCYYEVGTDPGLNL